MDFDRYHHKSQIFAIYPEVGNNLTYPTLGLCGEAGEVAEKVKKIFRDKGGVLDAADRLALIANLDLVITVDTSVAHVAGAVGKPVWLLSRFDGCWRWLMDRTDSPWYPTMSIYNQKKPGDWAEVVERV